MGIEAKFESNVIEFVEITAPQAKTATCVASDNDLQLTIKVSHFYDTSIVTSNAGQCRSNAAFQPEDLSRLGAGIENPFLP